MPPKRRKRKPSRKRAETRTGLGRALEAARIAKGLSMTELAGRVSVEPATVSDWEWGRYRPSIPHLVKTAAVLDTTVDGLLGAAA